MNGTFGRRVFVGSVAAGLPLAGASLGSWASDLPTRHTHPVTDGPPDLMFEHAARQLAAIVNQIQRHGVTAEHVRLAAAHFGTVAVYARQAEMDTPVQMAVRDLVRSKGRPAVLALEMDRQRVLARLKEFGVELDDRQFHIARPDHAACIRALDELSHRGITGMLARAATSGEHIAAELDRRGGRVKNISLVQGDDIWRIEFCARLWLDVSLQSAHAAMLCAAMFFMPGMESQCAFAQMSVIYYLTIYYALCA